MKRKLIALIALILITLLLTACGGSVSITVDENGVASWEPIRGAVEYEYSIVDAEYVADGEHRTTETSVQLPEGMSLHMRPIMKNGKAGTWSISDYYGTPQTHARPEEPDITEEDPVQVPEEDHAEVPEENTVPEDNFAPEEIGAYKENQIERFFTTTKDQMSDYEVIANIRHDTVQTQADGSVTFEADGPHGTPIRFVGIGVTVGDGTLTFAPGGRIVSLDSIGRICYVDWNACEVGDSENAMAFMGAYTFSDATSVSGADELYFARGAGVYVGDGAAMDFMSVMWQQGNMFAYAASNYNRDAFTLDSLTIGYDTATFCTPIKEIFLVTDNYGTYFEGELYDPGKEVFDFEAQIYAFHLAIRPELLDIEEGADVDLILGGMDYARSVVDDLPTNSGKFTIGDLLDAEGNAVDKQNASVEVGSSLEIGIQGRTYRLTLPVAQRKAGLSTVADIDPFPIPNLTGELNALVIPIAWRDQPENATDTQLDVFRGHLGRTADLGGTATDYSGNDYTLSRYFDLASYGKLSITSYMTDWYPAPYDFAEMRNQAANDTAFIREVTDWLYSTYPNTDWTAFDRDQDGCFDAVFLLNAGTDDDDMYMMTSWEGGLFTYPGLDPSRVGTPERPAINGVSAIHMGLMTGDGNVVVHEFGHALGLIDYYDVTYSGIDAVGSYDMQSANMGDWNAYSKYTVGWLEPTVVKDLAKGESVEITIGSMTKTGDAIAIPAAGQPHDGPFGEYILVDLYTDEGLYEPYGKNYGLDGVAGVRIYHVNAEMIETEDYSSAETEPYYKERTTVITQSAVNAYNAGGKYHIELLQNGGRNTFTAGNARTQVNAGDLFYAGDSFAAEDYASFLRDGKMDNNVPFGYEIEIVSIEKDANGEYRATIRITRQ